MSINNSSKYEKIKNKCNHLEEINKIKGKKKSYFYCYKCNHIILIYNNKEYCIYKCISKDEEEENDNYDKTEFDPILIVRSMIKRQEEQIRDINDKFVLNCSNNYNNQFIDEKVNEINNNDIIYINEERQIITQKLKHVDSELLNINESFNQKGKIKFNKLIFDEEKFDKYCEFRNKILLYIHKLCTKLKYNDNSFYITLYLADTFLSRIIADDITEKELFLVILGFFLVSSKYIEDDIFEPEFERFCNIEKNIDTITIDEIRISEVQCLTLINHNLYNYSVFDWINILLLNNGIVFEEEIDNINELENIFTYSQKILTLITSKFYFCRYSSMQIAFSIIHLSREKYINKDFELSELYKLLILLYGVEFSDYEECYNIIKMDLSETNDLNEEEKEDISYSNIPNIDKDTDSLIIKNNIKYNKTINKEINKYKCNFNKDSGEINNKISVDSNRDYRYIKTDMNINRNKNKNSHNLISSLDQKKDKLLSKKYKLNNNYYSLQNNSIEILDNIHTNKKLTPNGIRNINNNSLNCATSKNTNYTIQNNDKNLISNIYRKNKNAISSEKNQKANNTLYINYTPKFSIKNIPIINNINYINNINVTNDDNFYSFNIKKYQNNINIFNETANLNNIFRMKNNNHTLRKTLFKLDNIVPIQLNYEYNINTINNNKIKKEINDKNKLQNNNIQDNKIKYEIKKNRKLKSNNKTKFKTHLLLEFLNDLNINNILRKNSEQIPFLINRETRSMNKYDKNKEIHNLKTDENDFKINPDIKLKMLNNNKKSKKITLTFKEFVSKQINYENINKFLLKNKIGNSKRFKNLYNNFNNKQSLKNLEKKSTILNNESNGAKKNLIIEDNVSNKDNSNNNKNGFGRNLNNIINYKNMASFKSKLPKLGLKKNAFLTNK